jgi:hypothetical protein
MLNVKRLYDTMSGAEELKIRDIRAIRGSLRFYET